MTAIPSGATTNGLVGPVSTVQNIIPSYAYWQYADDDSIQAFVAAYNGLASSYLTWFNTSALPDYTLQSGPLLDWVATGLYGYPRPVLPYGSEYSFGTYGTLPFVTIPYGKTKTIINTNYYPTTDDIYLRCIMWHVWKGDGFQFTIEWLKRRVCRFLYGINFNPSDIYRISVSFGSGTCTIHISNSGGQTALAPVFAVAIADSVLATPPQFAFNVTY